MASGKDKATSTKTGTLGKASGPENDKGTGCSGKKKR